MAAQFSKLVSSNDDFETIQKWDGLLGPTFAEKDTSAIWLPRWNPNKNLVLNFCVFIG